jgi:hypothetical protein
MPWGYFRNMTDGDLKAAIAAYQKIAGNAAAPRDVRARALLQLAGCYEKLGAAGQQRLRADRARIR